MITQVFLLEPYDWEVCIFYDSEKEDADIILHTLRKIGCTGKNLRRAERNLYSGLEDTGLTYTNPIRKVTVSVIGHSTDPTQWWNTFNHEADHIAEHIAQALDIPCQGEDARYLKGLIAQKTIQTAGAYLCQNMCPYSKGVRDKS